MGGRPSWGRVLPRWRVKGVRLLEKRRTNLRPPLRGGAFSSWRDWELLPGRLLPIGERLLMGSGEVLLGVVREGKSGKWFRLLLGEVDCETDPEDRGDCGAN